MFRDIENEGSMTREIEQLRAALQVRKRVGMVETFGPRVRGKTWARSEWPALK